MAFKVLAIIPVYNEADILPGVLRHLHSQGVDTCVIDNWSTDGLSPEDVVGTNGQWISWIERFPDHPVHIYQWERILRRVEEVALEYSGQYDWMMLHDADEIRRGPVEWNPVNEYWILNEAIQLADGKGYNVIDFKVYTFPPVDNGWVPGSDPEAYFTHYLPDSGSGYCTSQEKCWKSTPGQKVNLTMNGGHKVLFERVSDRRVCPHKFILKHYQVRSQAHGERKVFEERQKRWHLGERGKQWHKQYDGIVPGHNFLIDPKELIEWK